MITLKSMWNENSNMCFTIIFVVLKTHGECIKTSNELLFTILQIAHGCSVSMNSTHYQPVASIYIPVMYVVLSSIIIQYYFPVNFPFGIYQIFTKYKIDAVEPIENLGSVFKLTYDHTYIILTWYSQLNSTQKCLFVICRNIHTITLGVWNPWRVYLTPLIYNT